jgi:8-oxo-dGTP diphosphatase
MPEYEKDLYFVAVKVFLRDEQQLLITHDVFGSWDLPGGRIRVNEFNTPLESVVARKVQEELGTDVRYTLGQPVVFFRVERKEHDKNDQIVRIFAVGYEARYEGGDVQLSEHHDQMEWVDIRSFEPGHYFTDG